MICGSGGSKSRLTKAASAEPAGQMRDEKLHDVVARSTFASQHVQNTSASDRFWKLRRRKSARCCGGKHMSKSKCTKHLSVGPLLEVAMSKKCTLLWREAHFQVKMYKAHQVRTTFGSFNVEKVHAVVAQSTFRSQKAQSTPGPEYFWKLRCRKSARRCGVKHISEVTMFKTPHVPTTSGRSDVVSRGRPNGLCTLSKVRKNVRVFVAFQKKNDGRRGGHLKRICKDAFSVAGTVQETCSSELLGCPGAGFLRGVAFWSISF